MDSSEEIVEKYVQNHTDQPSEILQKIEREAHIHTLFPRMISGNLQVKLIGFLAAVSDAKYILEIGTFTGYSAIALAEATSENCTIHCIEINEEFIERISKNIQSAGFAHRIVVHQGNAMKLLPELEIIPDFVYIDADKVNYLNYYKILIGKMKSGSIIIADNVLWSNKVVDIESANDTDTTALREFNDFIQNDPRVSNVMLSIRDGLMLIRKL